MEIRYGLPIQKILMFWTIITNVVRYRLDQLMQLELINII